MAEDDVNRSQEPNFGGRLLGTNGMQRAADKVARDIDKFGAQITALNRALQGAINSASRGAAYRGQPTLAFPAANQGTRLTPAPISHPPANTVTPIGGSAATFTHPATGRVYSGPMASRLSERYDAQVGRSTMRVQAAYAQAQAQQQLRSAQDLARQQSTLRQQQLRDAQMQREEQRRAQMDAQRQQQAAAAQARYEAQQNAAASRSGINPDLRGRFSTAPPERRAQARQSRLDAYYGSLFDEAIQRQNAASVPTWGMRIGQRIWAYNRTTGLSRATVPGSGVYVTRNNAVLNFGGGGGGGGGRGGSAGGGNGGGGFTVPPSGGFNPTVPANNSGTGGTGGQVANFDGVMGDVYKQAVKYGDRMRPQMEEMDRYTNWAYTASGGAPASYDKWGWKNQIRNHSYGTVVGKSTEDVSNAQFLLDKNFGLTYGTAAQGAVRNNAFGASYVAGLDAETGAKLYSGIYNPQASLAAYRLGYGRTIGKGGQAAGMGTLADNIMNRTFGSTSIDSKKFAAATASGQALDFNVDQLGKASGWDDATIDNLKEYMRGRNTLLHKSGMSSTEADQLIADASHSGKKGDAARKELSKYGVAESLTQSRKTFEAQERQHDANMGSSFAPAMENATKAVQKFESAINHILELPGIRQIVGGGGAWASVTKDQVSTLKSAWDIGKRLLPISLGGGAGDPVPTSGGKSTDKKKDTAVQGGVSTGNAAQAIQMALAQVGDPYIWGAEGPDAFDCSGLMQFAYRSAGIKLPRVSQQQMKAGVPVDKDAILPGDLLFPHPGHVMMALGGGKLVEAPKPGGHVQVRNFSLGEIKEVRRVASAVGATAAYNSGEKQDDNEAGAGNAGWWGGTGSAFSQDEVDALSAFLAGGGAFSMGTRSSGTKKSSNSAGDPTTDAKSAPADPKGNAGLGKKLAAEMYGWTGPQWDALYTLWQHESNWNHKAGNPSSGAYGIPQALPASKMASEGPDYRTNPATQIKWGLKYIKDRYTSPAKAWQFWQNPTVHVPGASKNWYAAGAWDIPEDQDAVVHKGEMIIPAAKAETIRQALIKDSVNVVSPAGAAASAVSGSAQGGGGGVSLSFAKGAIQINVNGAMSDRAASDAAKKVVNYIAADDRIKRLGVGV
ncbi:NlpC/P60 family protein [Streptomyces sp. NPDC091027]|uniref:aggregation-promoting factor C-terminal-like domain-containing protein n=1 Tax=Streptomyces sp. NPDC091027 TaxID=3365971 RepID=UPI00381064EE